MAGKKTRKYKITVRFRARDDGGLRALCSEVPGFFLSGKDKRAVMRDVIPVLEMLLKQNFGLEAEVSPLGYGLYELSEKSPVNRDDIVPDMPEYQLEYVVEKVAA